jgi:flavodoxin
MKKIVFGFLFVLLYALTACAQSNAQTPSQVAVDGKTLVAYFSRTGNTAAMARHIQTLTGGELFEIKTVNPYPDDYSACLAQARTELSANSKPALSTHINGMSAYDIVFIGYPIWHGDAPMAIRSFIEEYDFAGKTVIPFCTSGSSSGDTSFRSVERLCSQATVLEGLQIRGASVGSAEAVVTGWLRRIGVVK